MNKNEEEAGAVFVHQRALYCMLVGAEFELNNQQRELNCDSFTITKYQSSS